MFADKLSVDVEVLLPGREETAELRRLDQLRFSENVSLANRREFVRLLRQRHGA